MIPAPQRTHAPTSAPAAVNVLMTFAEFAATATSLPTVVCLASLAQVNTVPAAVNVTLQNALIARSVINLARMAFASVARANSVKAAQHAASRSALVVLLRTHSARMAFAFRANPNMVSVAPHVT